MRMIGMEGRNIFTNISKLADSQVVMTTEAGHPIHGLKRNLIRLIGNMSYCNKDIQDQVWAKSLSLAWTTRVSASKGTLQKLINSKHSNKNWIELTPSTHLSIQTFFGGEPTTDMDRTLKWLTTINNVQCIYKHNR